MLRLFIPVTPFNYLWIFPVTPGILNPSPSVTLRLICTALCTQLSPLFRSWTACPPGKGSTPAVIHLPSLHLMPCRPRPAPQVPFGPCIPAPQARFCCLVPRPVIPLSMPLAWFKLPCQPLWFIHSRFRPSSTNDYYMKIYIKLHTRIEQVRLYHKMISTKLLRLKWHRKITHDTYKRRIDTLHVVIPPECEK